MTAEVKISLLPALDEAGLTAADLVPVVNDGVTKKATISDFLRSALFKLPIVGAVFRSVFEKLSDTVSIKDFGAVGDGVTDDADAIEAAEASPATYIDLLGLTAREPFQSSPNPRMGELAIKEN